MPTVSGSHGVKETIPLFGSKTAGTTRPSSRISTSPEPSVNATRADIEGRNAEIFPLGDKIETNGGVATTITGREIGELLNSPCSAVRTSVWNPSASSGVT